MSKEILINANGYETRIALVDNGLLVEVWQERSQNHSIVGNIYKGRVEKVLPGLQAAFVNLGLAKSAFIHVSDLVEYTENDKSNNASIKLGINKLLHEGQAIVVQVYKDQIGSKGARITTQLSIPSRYLVMMPKNTDMIAVSSRIIDEKERERLLVTLKSFNGDQPKFGLIARTNAENASETGLYSDWQFLNKLWEKIEKEISSAKAENLIYSEFSLAKRVVRDRVNDDLLKITIDSSQVYKNISQFIGDFAGDWEGQLVEYKLTRPLFDNFNIDDEIERALGKKIELKSGGNLVFDQNEAMTTIDINTGQYVGYKSLEDTAFKTNLEAAQMIARQVRLRNIAGIIVIDFIDMTDVGHKAQVLLTLEECFVEDSVKTSVLGFTALGLVEMTRKRTTGTLIDTLCEPCNKCQGSSHIKTLETVCFMLFREISRAVKQFKSTKILVIASVRIVDYIIEEHSETLAQMEESLAKRVSLQAEESYGRDQFDVVLM